MNDPIRYNFKHTQLMGLDLLFREGSLVVVVVTSCYCFFPKGSKQDEKLDLHEIQWPGPRLVEKWEKHEWQLGWERKATSGAGQRDLSRRGCAGPEEAGRNPSRRRCDLQSFGGPYAVQEVGTSWLAPSQWAAASP